MNPMNLKYLKFYQGDITHYILQSPYGELKYPFVILAYAYDASKDSHLVLHNWVSKGNYMSSVRSGLGQSLQVRVHV